MSYPSQAALDAAERIYENRMRGKKEFAKELFAFEIMKAVDAETAPLKEKIQGLESELEAKIASGGCMACGTPGWFPWVLCIGIFVFIVILRSCSTPG